MIDNERRQFTEIMGVKVESLSKLSWRALVNDEAIERWFAERIKGWKFTGKWDTNEWWCSDDGDECAVADWHPLVNINQAMGMLTTPYVIASPDSFTDEGLGPRGDTFQVTVFKAHDMILTDGDGDDWELGESTDIKVAILLAVGRAFVAKEKGEKA